MVVVLDKFFPLLVIWKSFLFFVNFFFEERKRESEVAQSCLTVCNSVDSSLPGSSVHGILQARILEWVAISFIQFFFELFEYVIPLLSGLHCLH